MHHGICVIFHPTFTKIGTTVHETWIVIFTPRYFAVKFSAEFACHETPLSNPVAFSVWVMFAFRRLNSFCKYVGYTINMRDEKYLFPEQEFCLQLTFDRMFIF